MGKRELLLIAAFLVVGVVVYQATAPPAGPGDRGLSFSRMLDSVRREIRGNRASIDITRSDTLAITPEVEEIRLVGYINEAEVAGEDRKDVQTTVVVHSAAYDEEEARRYGDQTVLVTDRAGSSLILQMKYPREGRQRADFTLKVPSRLRVRVEGGPRTLRITNVAAVELTGTHDEVTVKKVAGRVTGDHRGGPARIEDVGALKFHGRGTELTATGVRGDAAFMIEGGELTASGIAGAIEIEARGAEVNLPRLEETRGTVRVNVTGEAARLAGVRSDTRIDGRDSEIDVTMKEPAPLTVHNVGEDVALTLPGGGYRLDAIATDGKVTPDTVITDLGLAAAGEKDSSEVRVSGDVRGGGPAITVRVTRGDLVLRKPD